MREPKKTVVTGSFFVLPVRFRGSARNPDICCFPGATEVLIRGLQKVSNFDDTISGAELSGENRHYFEGFTYEPFDKTVKYKGFNRHYFEATPIRGTPVQGFHQVPPSPARI